VNFAQYRAFVMGNSRTSLDSNQIRHPRFTLHAQWSDFDILGCGPMRILFVISLLALAALLWASVSIAQHIYRSRLDQKAASRTRKAGPVATSKPVTPKRSEAQRKAS
jgi:hypothetical protein